MNELDVVRVKSTVRVEELFHEGEIEIEANWEGTIVADANASTPMVEFTSYRDRPFLVNLDVANLEWSGNRNERT